MKKDLIYRQRYLNTVRPFIGKQLIKVFTGQRRVGKSYLLFQIMQEIRAADKHVPMVYINKEDLAFSYLKTAQDLADFVLSEKKSGRKNYFLLMKFRKSKILKPHYAHCCWMTNWICIARAAMRICFPETSPGH